LFDHFNKEKLYKNDTKLIQYLIWLIQGGCVLSTLSLFAVTGIANSLILLPHLFGVIFVNILLAQFTVLGIQAKSPLCWLLIGSSALTSLFSVFFPVGILIFFLLDQDEVIQYFKTAKPEELSLTSYP
jgi:hypothetical protein